MKCPDAECHDKVVKLNFFMKIFGGIGSIIVTALLIVVMYAVAADKEDKKKIHEIEKKCETYTIKQDTIIFNQSLFRQDIRDMKKESKEYREGLRKKMDSDKNDIIRAIRSNGR